MFFLSQFTSTTDLPQYKPIPSSPSRSPHTFISKRFWTAARISILCSFIVIAALAWNCGSQLVPEGLQNLQSQNAGWLSTVADSLTKNTTVPVTLPHPPPTLEIEGFVEPIAQPPVTADVETPKEQDTEGTAYNILDEQIDVVYTWVNGSDPEHLALKAKLGSEAIETRYDYNLNELRYSLRSLEQRLPWFKGNIYIVTPGQTPNWLNTSNPRIKIINQDDILPKEAVPTCNAFFLEFYLDRIPGLSEKFIYMNDDYFFLSNTTPFDLFSTDGRVKSFPNSPARKAVLEDYIKEDARLNMTEKTVGTNHNHDAIWQASMAYTVLKVREILDTTTVSFYHLPFVWERSIMEKVRLDFKKPLTAMYSHKFRHWRDLQAPSVIYSKYLSISNFQGHAANEVINQFTTRRTAVFGSCSDKPKDAETFEYMASKGKFKFGNMNSDFENPASATLCRKVLSHLFPGASQYELSDVPEGVDQADSKTGTSGSGEVVKYLPYGKTLPPTSFNGPPLGGRPSEVPEPPSGKIPIDIGSAEAAAKAISDMFHTP